MLGQPQIEVDFGFAGGTSARMAFACGQKRPRLSAGKALGQTLRRFLATDASQKSLPGLGPGKSPGRYAEVAVIRVAIPLFAIVGMHTGKICEIPMETTGTPTVQLAG